MYKPATKEAWVGRVDAADGTLGLRWHQAIQFLNLSEDVVQVPSKSIAFAFLGFCCDEGVRRNLGRVGAVAGPAALRSAMASFAYHLPEQVQLFDAGDVYCTNQNLESAQEQLGKKVAILLAHGYRAIVLGGGHETAYGHFLGLAPSLKGKKLGVVNFDAHFDLRSYAQQPSSGTPFLQLADDCKAQGIPFLYHVVGLQEYGNTKALFATADKVNATYTFAEDVQPSKAEELQRDLNQFCSQADHIYVTVDLDVFAAAYAPGVSAVNALGVQPAIVLDLLKKIISSGKLMSLDIAELNPTYDIDNRTAKLAASILYRVVSDWSKV